jgi:hypothetical protein
MLRALLSVVGDKLWQAQQVVGGATEDEALVDFGQATQLHLCQWAGLLEPAEGLFHLPAPAKRDRISGMPSGSTVEVRAAPFSFFCTCGVG